MNKQLPGFDHTQGRRKYDDNVAIVDSNQSMKASNYVMNPVQYRNCNTCFPNETQPNNITGDYQVNIDSNMKGLNNVIGTQNGTGTGNGNSNVNVMNNIQNCSRNFQEYTHLNANLNEFCINRFEYLPINPQSESNWYMKNRIGVNTTLEAKDRFRPTIPTPMDQTAGLPRGLPKLQCRYTPSECSIFVKN